MPTNPLQYPAYFRSIAPALPDSLDRYVYDELDKISVAIEGLVTRIAALEQAVEDLTP